MNNDEDHECPICVTIPPGKILQCKEGHILCESCILRIQKEAKKKKVLPKCPSCVGPLDEASVSRNRALENILDRLWFDCPHAIEGCERKLNRSEIKEHETNCKYGVCINICQLFGISDCNFTLSPTKADEAKKHLETNHSALENYGSSYDFMINVKQARARALTVKLDTANVLMTTEDGQKTVAINIKVTQLSFSFSCIDLFLCLSTEDKFHVTCSIPNVISQFKGNEPLISWSFAAVCGIDSWKFRQSDNSQLEIGIQSILQLCDENGYVNIHIRVSSSSPMSE